MQPGRAPNEGQKKSSNALSRTFIGSQKKGSGTPPQTPRTPSGLGQRVRSIFIGTPPPFTYTQSPTTPARGDLPADPVPGSGSGEKLQTALQKLFGGQQPLVRSKGLGTDTQYQWPQDRAPEDFESDISAVCHAWLEQPGTRGEALALLDAVYRKSDRPQAWDGLLLALGDTLAQTDGLSPLAVLEWLRRLQALASRATRQQRPEQAEQALGWARALATSLGALSEGPAAQAIKLMAKWERQAAPQTSNTSPTPPLPTPPQTPGLPRQPSTPWSPVRPRPLAQLDAQEPPPPDGNGRPMREPRQRPVSDPLHPLPGLDLSSPGTSSSREPLIHRQRPRTGDGLPFLPPCRANATPSPPPDGPMFRGLQDARETGDFQAFQKKWLCGDGLTSSLGSDDLVHSLKELLKVLESPALKPPQYATLLIKAYPLVSRHIEEAHIRSEYATAIHQHLPPEHALQLLLELEAPLPADDLAHPLPVQRLMAWGLPEDVAHQLAFDRHLSRARERLFETTPYAPDKAAPPLQVVAREGKALSFVLSDDNRAFSDAEVDAVLALAEAWQVKAPELAMALLVATEKPALELANTNTTQWRELVTQLQQYQSFAYPWLSVKRDFDPVQGRFSELKCQFNAHLARQASRSEKRQASKRLWFWIEQQMRSPQGLTWPELVAVIKPIETAMGDTPLLGWENWLSMVAWELERSGDAKPLHEMVRVWKDQPTSQATLHLLLRVLQNRHTDEKTCVAALKKVFAHLPTRGKSLDSNRLHAAYLQAVLARPHDADRQDLVEAYLAKHPFPHNDGSGDLLQQLSLMQFALQPPSAQVWDFLNDLVPPDSPEAWIVWLRLCQHLAPWMWRQMNPPSDVDGSAALPATDTAQAAFAALLTLTSSQQGKDSLTIEYQFEWLAALAEALPNEQARSLLLHLDAACATSQELYRPVPSHGGSSAPMPARLLALRAALQVLLSEQTAALRGGDASGTTDATGASGATAAEFFRLWFSARLHLRRNRPSEAQACVKQLRDWPRVESSGPADRLVNTLLQHPVPGEDAA